MKIADPSVPATALKLVPERFDYTSLAIVRSLGRLGVPTFAVHDDRRAPAAASRYDRDPRVWRGDPHDADATLAFLHDLGRSLRRSVLVPVDDVGSVLVADHAAELRDHFFLPEPPPGLAAKLYSKRGLAGLCGDAGVPTARAVFPATREDVVAFADDATFPVVVKGVEPWTLQQRTGFRLLVARTRDQLLAHFDLLSANGTAEVFVQEFVDGGADCRWIFTGYFDARSECVAGFTGRKLRQIPPDAGTMTLGIVETNRRVHELVSVFMAEVGYRGIVHVDLVHDRRDDRYKVLDVNPRVGAGFRLFCDAQGLDPVWALYLDLTGQRVSRVWQADGRRWVVENLDVVSALRGQVALRAWLASYRDVAEGAWFARDDIAPFGLMVAEFGSAKLAAVRRGRFRSGIGWRLRRAAEQGIQRVNRVATAGHVPLEAGLPTEERVWHDASEWIPFVRALRNLDAGEHDVFVDLGAGLGRAVVAAARLPFKRVIGVELSPRMADVARRNLAGARSARRAREVEIVTADALDFAIPDDLSVVYLCCPFYGGVFQQVLRNIFDSIDRSPRPVRLVYNCPFEHSYLVSTGRVKLLAAIPSTWPRRSRVTPKTILTYLLLPADEAEAERVSAIFPPVLRGAEAWLGPFDPGFALAPGGADTAVAR